MLELPDKTSRLAYLAQQRRSSGAGTKQDGYSFDYKRIEDFCPWLRDCPWVSPLALTANNVNSDLMIVGQDWAGERYLARRGNANRLGPGYDGKLRSNKTLAKLLTEAFDRKFGDVFATNAFVFVKPGGMSGSIPVADLRLSARTYTLQELAVVRPKLAICLGAATYNAFRNLHGLPFQLLRDASYDAPQLVAEATEIYGVPHPGVYGQRSTGGYEASLEIWKRLAKRLRASDV